MAYFFLKTLLIFMERSICAYFDHIGSAHFIHNYIFLVLVFSVSTQDH
jgi:hypothetical protein